RIGARRDSTERSQPRSEVGRHVLASGRCGAPNLSLRSSRCISSRPDRFCGMIPALLLIIAAVLFRIVTGFFGHADSIGWLNFAPIAAIALCAAAYFPWKYKFSVPMIALLISDVVLDAHYGFSLLSPFVLSHYIGFAIIGCLGLLLQDRASCKTLLPASVCASMLLSVTTNYVSLIYAHGYTKNFAGLIQ